MKLRVENTWGSNCDELEKEYGHILKDYEMHRENEDLCVVLSVIEEIKELDIRLREYLSSYSGRDFVLQSAVYQGLRFEHEQDTFILHIQDFYD